MAKAKQATRDVPGWAEQVEILQADKARLNVFKGRTFEALSDKEREDLLKAMAIRLQLIDPS